MATYEGDGKLFIDMLVGQIKDNHNEVLTNMAYLNELVTKNKRKIRGLKCTVFFLGVGLLIAASELAERKRSENYLKAEIDELKETVDKQQNYICGLDQKLDQKIMSTKPEKENDGGAADA